MNIRKSDFMDKWCNSSMGDTSLFLLVMSTIVTLCSMTVSFLVMLFSSGEDGYRLCFFKTIFFQAVTDTNGVTEMSLGMTGQYIPIVVFWGATFLFMFGVYYFIKVLFTYR